MQASGIEWCDATWNPTRGCTRVSRGCENCYAERIAARFSNAHTFNHNGVFDGLALTGSAPCAINAPWRRSRSL